ncbi:unnamed protein product, partial [Ilex paraguariensis]
MMVIEVDMVIVQVREVILKVVGAVVNLVPVFTVVLEGTLLIFCWDLQEKPSSVVKQVSYLDGTLGVAFIPRSAPHDFGSVTITIE